MVNDFESAILVESPSCGMYKFVTTGFDTSVVKIKKLISKNEINLGCHVDLQS